MFRKPLLYKMRGRKKEFRVIYTRVADCDCRELADKLRWEKTLP